MRRRFIRLAVAVVACSVVFAGAGAAARTQGAAGRGLVPRAGVWGTAKEVPGTAALNAGGAALVNDVSCASAGNCSAGGFYTDSASHSQAFVAGEVSGVWGTAKEVPGTAALNAGGFAAVNSVSCRSAGNCSIGGSYKDSAGRTQVFVAGDLNGVWGTAKEMPGTAALNAGGFASVASMSCGSAGNCSAGGWYADAAGNLQVWLAGEVNGVWGTAKEIPGTAVLNAGGNAVVSSLSCASAGNCSVGGFYKDSASHSQAFVAGEVNGVWGKAKEVPGTAALNAGGSAQVSQVSCASAGNCSMGGIYADSASHLQAFVAGEVNGVWGKAKEMPGTAALDAGGNAEVGSVSCGSAGNCSAGGWYSDSAGNVQAFLSGEVNGVWGTAKEVPGTAALNAGGSAAVYVVSCASAGNCSAVGQYEDSAKHFQAFVAGEVNGVWGTAKEMPGTAALNAGGNAVAYSVSCASAGVCSAGGSYTDSAKHQQAFVAGET
jgi:cytochrome c551/c552